MKSYCTTLFLVLSISFIGLSQNINVSNANVFDGEPYMAIDPNNQLHIVAAWMGFKAGQGIIIKTKYSNNGGFTWSTANEIPHVPGATAMADVSLEYDSNGNLFLCYINHEHTNFTQGSVLVRKSTDGGVTWENPVEAISIVDCPNKLCVDRPWIAVDNSGGTNDGAIYVTTINADQPTLVSPPYHTYLVVSNDGGASFSNPRFIDTTNYNVGTITQAGNSPVVDANGTFYDTYPSYDTSQSPFAHIYLASSVTLGADIDHANAYTVLIPGTSDPYAKKGGRMIADPSQPNHLAMALIGQQTSDADVFFMETYDAVTWTTPVRINDDPSGNGKLQDLVWGDFNENGDLAFCWRDRRNASASGYQTETEIYGAVKYRDSSSFGANFPVSSQQVAHAAVLEGSGNDFLNVRFVGDTLYTIWGDVRTGTVNIFLNKRSVSTGTSSTQTIHTDEKLMTIYPNPAHAQFTIEHFEHYENCTLVDASGKVMKAIITATTSTEMIPSGTYFVRFESNKKAFVTPLSIQH